MSNRIQLSRSFFVDEFSSPDAPSTGYLMDKQFIKQLQNARDIANVPFCINSGYRTMFWNKRVKGVKNSAHLKGLACDIATPNARTRFIILKSLLSVNFVRIGVYKTFIHVDADTTKSQRIVFYK